MSKVIYKLYGKVVNGSLIQYNPDLHKQVVNSLEGKEFELILKEKKKRVSLDQHGYYRGAIVKECTNYEIFGGWSEDDIHDFFADQFLSYKKTLIVRYDDGSELVRTLRKIESTSGLSTKEMSEFIEKVIMWLSSQGIVILSPEEYYLGKYKTTHVDSKE